MANKTKKNIKLETISEKAKKRKDFLIVMSIVVILGFLVVSIGMTFMSVDQQKVFKKRKEEQIKKKEVELIPERDFKENWAISVENTLENQNKLLTEIARSTKSDIENLKKEVKNLIIDTAAKQKEMIEQNAEATDEKIKELKKYLNDRLEKQENRIEEIAIMKGGGSVNIGQGKNEDEDIILDDDLLPPLPKPEEKKSKNEEAEETLEDIINENTEEELKTKKEENATKKTEKETKLEKKLEKTEVPTMTRTKITLVNIDTEYNKEVIRVNEERIAKMEELEEKQNNTYHVMLGLTKAYMVTGAYAPAFSAGDEEPLPVLLQAEGDILIANDDTANIDRCFLIGSAKGNMNSKTADIRLVSISCSLNGGKQMIEGDIQGWVVGENGIPGVQGELLHKNGAWLAQTFVAGFMQTFSDALANSGTTQITFGTNEATGDGVPIGQAVSDNAAAAAGSGMSTVFKRLGDYYLKMAEQIFPVIEVKGGRTVNILLRGGEDLEVRDLNKVDISKIEEDYEENEYRKMKMLEEGSKKQYTSNIIKTSSGSSGDSKANQAKKVDSKSLEDELLITE